MTLPRSQRDAAGANGSAAPFVIVKSPSFRTATSTRPSPASCTRSICLRVKLAGTMRNVPG